MKEIWINSELYIKSYEFSIFRDFFSDFLWIYFLFKLIKMNIKKMQKAVFTLRGHVDATWHSGPRGTPGHVAAPRGPTRHYIYIIFIYLIYIIRVFSLPYREGLVSLEIVRSYKPDDSPFLFSSGTNPHGLL